MQVSSCEGRRSALEHGCFFAELSVAENCAEVTKAFETVLLQCRRRGTTPPCTLDNNNSNNNNNNTNTKQGFTIRRFSVSKMLNSLIGAKLGGGGGAVNQQNGGGTVVVCQPADLYKHKVASSRRPPSFVAL